MRRERLGAVVLAAGAASRMGAPKQLLPFEGASLVRRAALAALAAGCEPVVVVTGSHPNEVRQALVDLPVLPAENADWRMGMGSSIRTGVARMEESQPDAVLITLADQPLVTAKVLARLLRARIDTGAEIVAAEYSDSVGVPALFDRRVLPELAQISPEHGCKRLLHRDPGRVTRVTCPEAAIDLDTPEDYARLLSSTTPPA